ncbi:hypothetical protein [Pseudomonas kulmbachensis]|uniref:Uncharacterized protein n=1 Tax=Pseudomonas kulmbachensis TaxID=3043408 RepID=A0ABW7LT84_9PSED
MDIDKNAPGNISQQGVTSGTDNEAGLNPKQSRSEVPLPPDDDTLIEEDMTDVDANNSVSSEHPEAGKRGRADDPGADLKRSDPDGNDKEVRGVPASDPESGA